MLVSGSLEIAVEPLELGQSGNKPFLRKANMGIFSLQKFKDPLYLGVL